MPNVFEDLRRHWNTNEFKVVSKQTRNSLKDGSLPIGGAKSVETITREVEKELGRTPLRNEVFKRTHLKKKRNESVEERTEQIYLSYLI